MSTLCDTRFAGRVAPSNESEDDLFTPTSPLPRYDLGQCPLNSIHLFPNHPNGLLTARMRDGIDRLYRATNLVIAIPNQGGFRGCFHSVLVNSAGGFVAIHAKTSPNNVSIGRRSVAPSKSRNANRYTASPIPSGANITQLQSILASSGHSVEVPQTTVQCHSFARLPFFPPCDVNYYSQPA